MSRNILASAISNIPHLAAFDALAEDRLNKIPLENLLIYIIDTVDVSALPWLARQFDVLGYRGMRLAKTEAEQREVIKNAIRLKRYTGTPWAIKEALRTIGYPDAVLVEHVGTGEHGWAEFRIDIDAGGNQISEAMITELLQMINIYKNVRSHLLALSYTVNFSDGFSITDEHNLDPAIDEGDTLFVGLTRFANGEYIADGSIDASSDSDSLTMIIV
jgi:phage tail P2-like protein